MIISRKIIQVISSIPGVRKKKIILYTWLFFTLIFSIQDLSCHKKESLKIEDLFAGQATLSAREKFKTDLIANTIEKNLVKSLTDENEGSWEDAFWGMALTGYHSETTGKAIQSALDRYETRSLSFQRSLLESIGTVYPGKFIQDIKRIIKETAHPKIFAMAAHLLLLADPDEREKIILVLKTKFQSWQNHPILIMLEYDLSFTPDQIEKNKPPIQDLLRYPLEKGKVVIYSFQRPNRDFPGLALFRQADGNFLRDLSGNLFHVQQLSRSLSNLPGYLTNGNSPQGIYSLQGTDQSENLFIGPTPNLQMVLPFEVPSSKFFHSGNPADTVWSQERYRDLLPASWQTYLPIWEAYHAGRAGRSEIIAHGTTIDINFYQDKPYFPFTPSLGCLTTKEIWSEKTGRCLYSDQLALANAYLSSPTRQGYLVLVEIDDKNQPVQLDEILKYFDN